MCHDACGVGFIADTRRRSQHDIVVHGLTALRRLTHRGAPAALGAVDGCGVLTAIPWKLVSTASSAVTGTVRALGMVFVHPSDRGQAEALVERELRASGATALQWRVVPTDPAAVLPSQRATTPVVLQAIASFAGGHRAVEAALYRARLRIERTARREAIRSNIISLSTRTVVYKGLVTPDGLDRFYPDLRDARFATDFVVFHQRFSDRGCSGRRRIRVRHGRARGARLRDGSAVSCEHLSGRHRDAARGSARRLRRHGRHARRLLAARGRRGAIDSRVARPPRTRGTRWPHRSAAEARRCQGIGGS